MNADVVEVVRCKDCYCGDWESYDDEEGNIINYLCCLKFEPHEVAEDDYCSYGERREDDKGRSD